MIDFSLSLSELFEANKLDDRQNVVITVVLHVLRANKKWRISLSQRVLIPAV